MPRYLFNLDFIDGAWVNEIYPQLFRWSWTSTAGEQLAKSRQTGVSPSLQWFTCWCPRGHTGLHLFYVFISIVCGNMGRYKSLHFNNRIFGVARCSTNSAQVFHSCLPGSHILVGRLASFYKALPLWGGLVTGGALLSLENKISCAELPRSDKPGLIAA
jgi:hypothetical protein